MKKPVRSQVVVITGASSGIGRATALTLARRGATVVLAARHDEALRELEDACRKVGGRALAVPTDVAVEEQVRALAASTVEHFGHIDAWVNNAGVYLMGKLEDTPPDAFRQVLETNFFGVVHGARAVLPVFREQGRGILINVASVAGKATMPYLSAYNASKHAVVGFSESLRMELLDSPGIHVCVVLPAAVDTPLFQHSANYTGRQIKAAPPVYPPSQVVRAILDNLRRPRRETSVGGAGLAMRLAHALMPGAAYDRVTATQVDKSHFAVRQRAEHDGNLFAPAGDGEVTGGWREPGRESLPVGVLTGAAVFGLGLWLSLRVRQGGGLEFLRVSRGSRPRRLSPTQAADRLEAIARREANERPADSVIVTAP